MATSALRKAAALGAGGALLLGAVTGPASAQQVPVVGERVFGADRYGTAAQIALATFPEGTTTALLARGDDFADAIAASSLAGQREAPVLLTRSGSLPPASVEALQELGVEQVLLLGGTDAISADVRDDLAADYDVERVFGPDRFETAAQIARETALAGELHTVDGRRAAIVVDAEAFPDALAAGAPAAALGMPILLVSGAQVPAITTAVLDDLDIGHVYVVGGAAVVEQPVLTTLRDQGLQVERLAGGDRTATAVAVARAFVQLPDGEGGVLLGAETVVLARGDDPADALAAGPHAGRVGAAILLTASPTVLGRSTAGYLDSAGRSLPRLERVRVVGGPQAVSDAVLSEAVASASPLGDGVPSFSAFPLVRQTPTEGSAVRFSVSGLEAGSAYALALFPCATTQGLDTRAEPDSFADGDGDGTADRRGSSDQDVAAIVEVNGDPVDPTGRVSGVVAGGAVPQVALRVSSATADCASVVLWEDRDGDEQLRVGPQGLPLEPYAAGQVDWRALGADGLPVFGPADDQQAVQGEADSLRLDDVRTAAHDGYDRVVFAFTGEGTPGWSMRYTDRPRQQGSGFPIELEGTTALSAYVDSISMPEPGQSWYDGPERLDGPGQAVLEVYVGGVFEGGIDNFIGTDLRHPFRVFRLEDPVRVVVDVRHP